MLHSGAPVRHYVLDKITPIRVMKVIIRVLIFVDKHRMERSPGGKADDVPYRGGARFHALAGANPWQPMEMNGFGADTGRPDKAEPS